MAVVAASEAVMVAGAEGAVTVSAPVVMRLQATVASVEPPALARTVATTARPLAQVWSCHGGGRSCLQPPS